VSQSAVTLAVRELEQELGVRLLDRTRTGVSLTRRGEIFHRRALDIETAFALAASSVWDESKVEGEIRLGVTETLSSYFLFPRLTGFIRRFPDVRVTVEEHDRERLEEMLIEGSLDLALLLTSNVARTALIETETFHHSRRRLWVAPGHALTRANRVTFQDIARFPYACLTSDEAHRQAERYWSANEASPKIVFRSASVEAVRSLVSTGEAVTILSDVVYRPWTLDGRRVEKIDVDEQIPTMDVGVGWRKGSVATPAMTRFRQTFATALSEPPSG
jgi:DNA-binding transcriptional LysR family regulator